MPEIKLTKTFYFDAAHNLKLVPKEHKCSKIHGHTFRVDISVKGEIDNKYGWVMDFAEIKKFVNPIIKILDHNHLNTIEGLGNGTSEILSIWLWDKIKPLLPQLCLVEVWESKNSKCSYSGE